MKCKVEKRSTSEQCGRATQQQKLRTEGQNVKQQQISHGGKASRRKALQERKEVNFESVCKRLTKF